MFFEITDKGIGYIAAALAVGLGSIGGGLAVAAAAAVRRGGAGCGRPCQYLF